MEINILDKEVVSKIIGDINSQQNVERKRKEWAAYQCTQGGLKDYVESELSALFPKNHKKMRVSDISISKKVVDKLAKSYCKGPLRTLGKDASEASKEYFNDIYKYSKFNNAYQEYDAIFNLHRHGLFWVDYDYEKKSYRPYSLRPYEYDLVRDSNNGEVKCVILNYPDLEITANQLLGSQSGVSISDGSNQLIAESQYDSGSESKIYALWTKDNHVVVVVQKKVLETGTTTRINYAVTYVDIPNNPLMINPLGVLPFVYKQKSCAADYPLINQLTSQTINFNILYSDLLTAATVQGYGQAVLKYPDDVTIKDVEIGYMTAIKLVQSSNPNAKESSFDYVNANPDLAGQQKTYLTYLKQVLSEHGINSSQAIAGDVEQFASGLDRMIAMADVQSIIEENEGVYEDLENEVFEIIKAWEKVNNSNIFSEDDELIIKFQKPTIQVSDTDKLNNIKMMLDLGLITKAKALMMIDPNLSEDEAQDQLDIINEEKKKLIKDLGGMPGEETSDEVEETLPGSKPGKTNNQKLPPNKKIGK